MIEAIDMNQVTEILTVAKELLESEVEWCKGQMILQDESGTVTHVCAVGALKLACQKVQGTTNTWEHEAARKRLGRAVPVHFDLDPVPRYNDLPSTSKEDVLLMFKHAIEND